MKHLHAIVYGKVQGVFFRAATQTVARQLGVVGWVRNLPDSTVEVVAEGKQEALEELAAFLHKGPQDARVSHVEIEWQDANGGFSDFQTLNVT